MFFFRPFHGCFCAGRASGSRIQESRSEGYSCPAAAAGILSAGTIPDHAPWETIRARTALLAVMSGIARQKVNGNRQGILASYA